MSNYCCDCGCKVFNGACTNCNEEIFIVDQYRELDMDLPDDNSNFSKKLDQAVINQIKQLNNK